MKISLPCEEPLATLAQPPIIQATYKDAKGQTTTRAAPLGLAQIPLTPYDQKP